ncbi:hypothetical protein ACLB2K_069381 [Fragaria x ananassa]
MDVLKPVIARSSRWALICSHPQGELTIKNFSSVFCNRLGEDGEDLHKIKHLPSVIITGSDWEDYKKMVVKRASRPTWGCLKGSYESSKLSELATTLVCTNGGFPNLEFLYLGRVARIKRVEGAGRRHASSPQIVTRCDELRAVPDGLQYVTALKELTFKSMPIEFCERLEEHGDDFHKIKHVPFLTITGTSTRRGW